jgi:hypothetical protein
MDLFNDQPRSSFELLPNELTMAGAALRQAIDDNQHVPAIFAEFCARAYSRPDWAGAASQFIVECFAQRQKDLAVMARVSDLVIELTSGQQILTMTVVSQWVMQGDILQLLKLGDALIVAHSTISGPEVVHLMLALATSLAILRYPRALQLLAAAEPRSRAEHEAGLAEAKQWLDVGALLRGCPQSAREMFNHRLRRPRTAWQWDRPQERAALQSLAEQLTPGGHPGLALVGKVLPAGWLEQAIEAAATRSQQPEAGPEDSVDQPHQPAPPPIAPELPVAPPPRTMPWQQWPAAWQFFTGGLAGIALVMLVIWLSPVDLRFTRQVAGAEAPQAQPSPPPAQKPEDPPSVGAKPTAAAPAPSPSPVEETSPLTTQSSPPSQTWSRAQLNQLLAEQGGLKARVQRLRQAGWEEARAELELSPGADATRIGELTTVLRWLHLDPPADEEMRRRVPQLLADHKPDGDTLELWQQLAQEKSLMRPFIEREARRQVEVRRTQWSASQRDRLNRLGWSAGP